MKCIALNLFLLICIGVYAACYTAHILEIDNSSMILESVLKSAFTLISAAFCMASMVKITRTYAMTFVKYGKVYLLQNKEISRLYTSHIAMHGSLASISYAMMVF